MAIESQGVICDGMSDSCLCCASHSANTEDILGTFDAQHGKSKRKVSAAFDLRSDGISSSTMIAQRCLPCFILYLRLGGSEAVNNLINL